MISYAKFLIVRFPVVCCIIGLAVGELSWLVDDKISTALLSASGVGDIQRYNLAMIQYQNGRMSEALSDFKECYRVDITYRDVRSWIEKIETELASSGS